MHGSFDGRSHARSAQAWASRHHGVVGAGLALAAAGAAAGLTRRTR
jgi:hypothetical protein